MSFMLCNGKMIKDELHKKGIKLTDVSLELGKSHSYLSNCLSQGYLDDRNLRYICAKYGINYQSVRRGWAYGKVTQYGKPGFQPERINKPVEVVKPEIKPEVKIEEKKALTTEEKIDLILLNMQELNTMMAEIIRRDNR